MAETVGRRNTWRVMYAARSSSEVVRRYLPRLCRLRDEGFEVHVLAADDGGFGILTAHGIVVRPLPIRDPRNAAGLAGAFFILQGYFLEYEPVLVHTFSHRLAWISTFAARQASVPAVFVSLEYHWLEEDPLTIPLGPLGAGGVPGPVEKAEGGLNAVLGPPFRRSMHAAYRWLGEQVQRYIVTTEFDFQLLQDMNIVAPEKLEISLGGAGVDLERFSLDEGAGPRRDEARRDLRLPNHWRQVVGAVGPMTRRHGTDDLVAVISALGRTHPSVGWLIAPGIESDQGQLRRLGRLAERGFVHILDEGRPGPEIYRALDVLAWFGRASTPHDAITEAAAMTVPTIGYDTPGARSLVEHGETGLLVLEEDRAAASAMLRAILDNPKRLRDLGLRARSRATLRFARQAVDDQSLRLYDAVLNQRLAKSI